MLMVREKSFYATLIRIALPMALQGFLSLGVSLLDNMMVGALGETALSAVSLANQVTVFFTFFVRGVSGGSSALISQYWGKKDFVRIKQICSIVFQVSMTFSAVIAILVFFFPYQTMRIFTNDVDIITEAIPYLRIVCFSYILYTVSESMIAVQRSIEVVKVALLSASVSLVVNLSLNYILIFGKFGAPAMGIRGAAVATLVARGVEMAISLFYLLVIQKRMPVSIRDFFLFNREMWHDFLRYAVPIIVSDIQWGLQGVVRSMIIGRLGEQMVSAYSMADVVMSLGLIFTQGLASAACVVIGKTVGQGLYRKTREYSRTIQILFVCVGIVMASAVFLSKDFFIGFYQIEDTTKILASQLLTVGAISMLGTAYHMACFTGINRGAGDSNFVFKVDTVCGWCIVMPCSLLAAFVFHAPLWVVFMMLKLDQFFKWAIALIRLRGDKWIRNMTRTA